jgi:site-specific recombinase XerD
MTDTGFRIVTEAAEVAGIGFGVHPHMLRHNVGHMLADEGLETGLFQDFLRHRDIRSTVRYTKLSPHRSASVRVR